MANLFIFNTRGPDDEEISLGMPDDIEVLDHKHHVARCALRYKLTAKWLRVQSAQLSRVQAIGALILLYLVATNEQLHEWLKLIL